MRPLKTLWIGLGLLALQLHGGPVWVVARAHAGQVASKGKASAGPTLIRRVFNPANKTPLPNHWPIAGNTYVSSQEYADLKGGVQELLKRYPPSKYFFVGLGRDPAPVIAFLQNLGEKELAVNLPGTSNIQWEGRAQPADIARHIEAAIPEAILKGDRQIVVLDVTGTGKTPAIFGPYMDSYLQSRGINKKVVRLAFSWTNVKAGGHGPNLTDWINTSQWADFTKYYTGKYEGNWAPNNHNGTGIAEHQRHEMGPNVQPPTATNPSYTAFRQAVLARMEQDEQLDHFLVKEVGVPTNKEELAAWTRAQRSEQAKQLVHARAFPVRMKASLASLTASLPLRAEGHEKGPYLSENGEQLNKWLNDSITELGNVGKDVPMIAKAGPNKVTTLFMDHLESALEAKQLRNRDYRRLMGHALSASTMDPAMLQRLATLYKTSKHFAREVDTEAQYFLTYHREKQTPETVNMEANFRALMAHIDPARAL